MGSSSQKSETQQSSQTSPWAPTQPLLQNILGGINSQFGNYQPNSAEQGALSSMASNAQNVPTYGSQAQNLATDMLSGGPDNTGIMSDAYHRYQQQLDPYASGQNLDPLHAPGMRSVLDTIRNDVGNSVNGMFAGAGRDLSGMNQQTLARGIAQGEAVPLLNQYNQNVQNQLGSAANLYGAGMGTAQGLQGLQQTQFGNRVAGLDIGMNAVPGAMNNRANAILAAQAAARKLPLQNLGMLEGLTLPIAGLGGQSTGQSNTQNTYTPSLMSQIGQGVGLFGSIFSDRRLKTDIEQVGELYDGTPIYRFRYVGQEGFNVGLMADDVEKYAPEAVEIISGFKAVNYGKATERALEARAS